MSESISDNIEAKFKGAITNSLLSILVSLVRPLATLTEIFFRKDMGERYFNGWNFIVGFVAIYFSRAPFLLDNKSKFQMVSNLIAAAWAIALLFFSYLHRQKIIERYQKNLRWHSYNIGIPRYDRFDIYAEKAITIIAGILFFIGGVKGIGGLIFFSGITSLILRGYEISLFREKMLNTIDSQIEQANFAKAMTDLLPPQQVEGLLVHPHKNMSREFRERYVRAAGCTPESKLPQEK